MNTLLGEVLGNEDINSPRRKRNDGGHRPVRFKRARGLVVRRANPQKPLIPMRVATNAYTDSMVNQLQLPWPPRNSSLQSQASTGLRVQAPSDDPVAMQNTLNFNAENATQQTQYGSNISTLQTRADARVNPVCCNRSKRHFWSARAGRNPHQRGRHWHRHSQTE